ncbi:MAG: type I restriction endonuclease subunit M, partial [Candidatus Poribacteria bacterium]|nr:type I restriction endonuclease subunit M [Candidatus Poribacteria bacterium]
RDLIQDKDLKETPDLTIKKKKYKMDLIPPALIVARYFTDEQAEIDIRQSALETAEQKLEEYIEEHTGDEGLLVDAVNDSGNITKANVKARLEAIQPDLMRLREAQDNDDERDALENCLLLIDTKAKADKQVKQAQLALDEQVLARYNTLTETEIKQLVIDYKWFATIQADITSEVQRLTQNLTERVKELEERYAQPLPDLEQQVEAFGAKVEEHLQNMGLTGYE